jgi:hypothetical protein
MITITLPKENLTTGLENHIELLSEAIGVVFAEEMKKIMAVYPNYTPDKSPGQSYYERGSGTVYVKVKGGVTKYRNSEMLGRKWDIVPSKGKTVLRNTASYAAYVHLDEYQNRVHDKRGWSTEKDALEQIDLNEVYNQALKAIKSKI